MAATAAEVKRAYGDNKLAQVLYHDWEAQTYDHKWSISFDERCIDYARDRFVAIAGPAEPWPYGTALELGAGTGFFSLNLRQAGVLDEVHVTDLSPGMVDAAKANAERLGFTVEGRVVDAERIPYDDNGFDVVVGHAVIHHIPDVEQAFREMLRVLKPGGRFVVAGEPTQVGDWYARRLGRLTWKAATAVTQLPPLRQKWGRRRDDSSTCTPSTRATSPAWPCGQVPSTCARRLKSSQRPCSAGRFARSRRPSLPGRWAGTGPCSPTARGSGSRRSTGSCRGWCRSSSATTSASPA